MTTSLLEHTHVHEIRWYEQNAGFSHCNSVAISLTASQASKCTHAHLSQMAVQAHQPDPTYFSSQVTGT